MKNKRSFLYSFKKELTSHPLSMFAFILLLMLVAFVTIYSLTIDVEELYKVKLLQQNLKPGEQGFILGTDNGGKDVFKMLVIGTRNSLAIATAISLVAGFIGINIGVCAGYFGKITDNITMRLVDFISLLPSLIFMILIISTIKNYTVVKFILVIIIFNWIGYVRMIRASTLAESKKEYIMASKVLGSSNLKIIYKQLMPNLVPLITLRLILGISFSMGIETGLTYLGYGLPVNTPSLGSLISLSRQITIMRDKPWLWAPAILVLLTLMLCINATGQSVNRALQAKQKV